MLASKSCLLIENIESFSKSFEHKDIMLLEDRREISKYSKYIMMRYMNMKNAKAEFQDKICSNEI